MANKRFTHQRVLAFIGAVLSILAILSVFQNCSSLDSPSSGSGGGSSLNTVNAAMSNVAVTPGQVANLVVVLDRSFTNTVTVSYKSFDDTAVAGVHYTPVDSSLDLPAGQINFQIAVSTLSTGGVDFTNKRFRVEVSFAGNAAPQVSAYVSFQLSGGAGGLTEIQKSSNVGLLSVGQYHSCATKNDALYCWGNNGQGQLGSGNTANRTTPGLVASMDTGVTAVAAGRLFTCGIKAGALYCWGHNANFQLGDGTNANSTFPKPVFDMGNGVQAVSAGYAHACAIKNGGLYCWGENTYAQSGHNNGNTQQVPLAVQNFTTGVTAVATGTNHTCAIKGGALYCWGFNNNGQLGIGNTTTNAARNPVTGLTPITGFETGVIGVSATGFTTCATKGNGAFYCWGANGNGQLGLGNTVGTSAPNLINGFDLGVQHIISGTRSTCAIKTTGLHCWGANNFGQLGNGATAQLTAPSATPVSVTLNAGESFVHVGVGGHGDTATAQAHTCGRTNQNRVFCWGYNGQGQIGDNTTANKLVPTLVGL